jgi:hypothetical protein
MSKVLEEQFPQPLYKVIKIRDNSDTWPAQISSINGQDVLLALTSKQPDSDPSIFTKTYFESLMRSVYALGPVKGNAINLRLYSGTGDYWTGSGSYWILFVLPDKALNTITWVYLSKEMHGIYAETTQLYNTDFMPPYQLNLDISGVMPF